MMKVKETDICAAHRHKWRPDEEALIVLDRLGIPYTIEFVLFTEIDWELTVNNMGRTGRPTNQDLVDDYALAMSRGAIFPMAIISRRAKRAVILGGVHRCTGAKNNGEIGVLAYVVSDLPISQDRIVSVMHNRLGGWRTTTEEGLVHAVQMVEELDVDPAEVADLFGVDKRRVQEQLRIRARRKELVEAGCYAKLTDAHVDALAPVSHSTKVMAEIANIAQKNKLTAASVRDVARKIASVKSEAKQIELVDDEKRKMASLNGAATKVRIVSVRTKMRAALSSLETILLDKASLEQLDIVSGSEEHEYVRSCYRTIRKKLDALLG